MGSHKKNKIIFFISCIFLFISSYSFLVLPYIATMNKDEKRIYSNMVGAFFWAGLIIGLATLYLLNRKIKTSVKKIKSEKMKLPGIFRFFSNKEAMIVDICFIIGIVFIVFDLIFNCLSDVLLVVAISSTIFSFYLHCILNGRMYRYVKLLCGGEKNVR